MPGSARARRYSLISGPWSVLRFGQMPGYTQMGLRHAASISRLLQRDAVHVGRRPAEVGDDAGEARHLVADRPRSRG